MTKPESDPPEAEPDELDAASPDHEPEEAPVEVAPPSARDGDPARERPASPYDTLDASKIVDTSRRLADRIADRFPTSSLAKLSEHLVVLAEDAQETAEWIARPNVPLRVATAVFSALVIAGVAISISAVPFGANLKLVELVAAVESSINDVILIGAALIFLVSLEGRIKRHRALKALHRLRSMAHITDMHQLTKVPERLDDEYETKSSSPESDLTPFELGRYLDYSAEP